MFHRAGFVIRVSERSYLPSIDDPEIEPVMLRAQEMSRYVQEGVLDCGITGSDWIKENGSKVIEVADLLYSKQLIVPVRWVLAVSADSAIKSARDLDGKRIATELVNVTKKYLANKKVKAEVEFSWGATEVKVREGLADAIVELTETGQSLKAHNLRVIDTVCESTTKLIANKRSLKDAWKKKKIDAIALLLKGAITAQGKVGLKMNAPKRNIDGILAILPAMKKPTINSLSDKNWVAVEVILDEKTVREIIPKLKEKGAQGIVEYPLNKVIY